MKRVGKAWASRELAPLFFLAFLLAGCATAPKVDWNSRIGNYTYDQAVVEFGPPDRAATLTDGTRVVEWVTARGSTSSTSGMLTDLDGPFYRYYDYPGPMVHHYTTTTTPDAILRLTFGPDGKLVAWRRGYR